MIKRIQVCFVLVCFACNIGLPSVSFAQSASNTFLNLPAPGTMLSMSSAFKPVIVRGLQIDPKNPLQFNFIVDTGDAHANDDAVRQESAKMIKYFLTALTVPEKQLWVNLSPYEKDRIIANGLGQTEMGRDMLAQDYILKQLTASIIYPEGSLGKVFWAKVYKQAQEKFGTTNVPVNTFNKVWILPDHATIYEHNGTAFITENKLKVMLEEDYLSLQKHTKASTNNTHSLASQIIRETVLPELEREVNTGKNFAQLRQIANAVVLATWYKMNLQQSLLGQVYANKNKVAGVDVQDKNAKLKIYNQYLMAFKKGVYNYIKEDVDPLTNQTVPRKYFSGGTRFNYSDPGEMAMTTVLNGAQEFDISRTQQRFRNVLWDATPESATPAKPGSLAMTADTVKLMSEDSEEIGSVTKTGDDYVSTPARVAMLPAALNEYLADVLTHFQILAIGPGRKTLTDSAYAGELVKYFEEHRGEYSNIHVGENDSLFTPGSRAMVASDVKVVAQFGLNVTDQPGKQTGATSLVSLQSKGATGAIISHSEVIELAQKFGMSRAKMNKEIFAPQVEMAFNNNLQDVILALGETQTERDSGKTQEIIRKDILARIGNVDLRKIYNAKRLIIAYEPRWAIGKVAATPQDAQETIAFIRSVIFKKYGTEAASKVRILYGGAVDGNNVAEFMAQSDIDGVLVGGKSLSVETAKPILDALQAAEVKQGRVPYFGANWKTDNVKSSLKAFGLLFKDYDPKRVNIGVAPTNDMLEELVDNLKIMGASRQEQLNYNQQAMRDFSRRYRDAAIDKEASIIKALGTLTAGTKKALTVRRTITTSSQGAPQTTVLGPDGQVRLWDTHTSIHVSEGLSDDPQSSLVLVPGERGKVAEQMTIVLPTQANVDAESLEKALRSSGVSVRTMTSSQALQPSDNVVIDKKSISVKQGNGVTQIDLNLWYDVGSEVDTTLKADNPLTVNGLSVLKGSRQEASRSIQPEPTGSVKNLFINGAKGRIGSQIIRQWVLAGPDSNINLVLGNGVKDVQALIKALQEDSVHGPLLVRGRRVNGLEDHFTIGKENGVDSLGITFNGKVYNKIYLLNDRSDYSKLPIGDYDAEIAVDAIVNGETADNLDKYLEAGAIRVIHTSPSKAGEDGQKAFAFVFGATDHQLRGQDKCDSASCTTNSVAPAENALMQVGGIVTKKYRDLDAKRLQMLKGEAPQLSDDLKTETMHIQTIHAATNSDDTVDKTRPSAIENMARLEKSGVSTALPGLLEDLKGGVPMSADALRVPVADMSISGVTKVVTVAEGKTLTVQQIKEAFIDASKMPQFKGKLDVIEGGFNSKQLLGASASSTILLDSIEVVKVAGTRNNYMIHYKTWYDNEWGFTARIWDTILAVATDMDRNPPKAKTVEELFNKIDHYNSKIASGVIAVTSSPTGEVKVDVNNRTAFVAEYGLLDYLVREAQFNPDVQVRLVAQQIIRKAANSLNIRSASRDNYVGSLPTFNAGTGSGSNYMAMQQIFAAARDTSSVPLINLNPPDRRFEKKQNSLTPELNAPEEAQIPVAEDFEPGYVPAAVAAGYAAAIKSGYNGLVFFNLDNIDINPENFAPYGPFVGKSGFDKVGDPIENALNDAKARILEAAKAGTYNYQLDITPLIKYAGKNADAVRSKLSFVLSSVVELTKFVRNMESQIGFLSQPLSVTFLIAVDDLTVDEFAPLEAAVNKELNRQELAPVSFELKSKVQQDNAKNVQLFVLNAMIEAKRNNQEAILLRNSMINFMEGLIFKNDLASEETKARLKENGNLKAGGQRYSRHRSAWMKALELGSKQGKSLEVIFDEILQGANIQGLTEEEKGYLNKLLDFMFIAFRQDIFNFVKRQGLAEYYSGTFYFNQKGNIARDLTGKAFSIEAAVNADFKRDPRKTLQPQNGRTTLDRYQRWHQANAGKVSEYQEPEVSIATMELQLDPKGNFTTESKTLTTVESAVGAARAHRPGSISVVRGGNKGAVDKIEQMIQHAFAGKSERFKANVERLYQYGALAGTRRLVILPIDQATEHSPSRSHEIYPGMADKDHQIELAYRLGLSGYAALAGTIEFLAPRWSRKIPLIAKVNMSSAVGGNPKASQHSALIGNIEQLAKAGVAAIGYTIYPGSLEFNEQINELRQVIDEANKHDIPVITWAYPRGGERLTKAEYETALDVSIAAANMALEAGAAIVKVKPPSSIIMDEKEEKELIKRYKGAPGTDKFVRVQLDLPGRIEKMKQLGAWNGARDLIFSGGPAKGSEEVLREIADVAFGGGNGAIVGRNMFQRPVDEAADLGNKILALEKAGSLIEDGVVSFKSVDEMMEYALRDNKPGDLLYDIKADFNRRNPDWSDYRAKVESANAAMTQAEIRREGGINFDPSMYSLQIKRDGNGFPLPMEQQPIVRINVRGFRGIIMGITKANLPLMLGLAQTTQQLALNN